MKQKANRSAYRNPFHDHPLMTKGGVHEKSEKSKRQANKQKLKKGEWDDPVIYASHSIIPFSLS